MATPTHTAGLTPEEVNQRVETWIEAEMRRIDPAAYSSTDAGSTHAPHASAGR
jgi:1-acyl-sn-glycerol-3-phosphate acyltransferase